MAINTATAEGRQKRLEQLVEGYIKTGNIKAIIRLIGGSADDWRDNDSGAYSDERYSH